MHPVQDLVCLLAGNNPGLVGVVRHVPAAGQTVGDDVGKHPWTNGQVERIPLTVCRQTAAGQQNRTIKEGEADQKTIRGIVFPLTVKRFHYDDHDKLRGHRANFISAYNFGRRLKTLKGLTPYEFICKQWTIEPERFTLNPIHQMPGLNTLNFAFGGSFCIGQCPKRMRCHATNNRELPNLNYPLIGH